MADFGGIMRFTYNGNPVRIKAKVEVEPVNARYTVENNQDGSFCRYVQPEGPTFDIEFVDTVDGTTATSLPWDAILSGGPYNIALVEETNGILHTWANAQFLGRPHLDRLKGSVTGITGQAPVGGYLQTSA
jgi:hypothetical protein